jgi:3-aminobutyryl-CoA ammonia-lyase
VSDPTSSPVPRPAAHEELPIPADGVLSPAAPQNPIVGVKVVHRRYVAHSHSHYGGNLVDGAFSLACFGDVATELCIRTDGDEGLFAGYSEVQFLQPVVAGDVLEAEATVIRVGRRSREIAFEARVVCRSAPERGPSAAAVLDPALVVTRARGTVVVPIVAGM